MASNPESLIAQSIFSLVRVIINGEWQPAKEEKSGVVTKIKKLLGQ